MKRDRKIESIWQREGDTVAMHYKDGTMLDIREIKEHLSENNDGIQLLKK